MKSFIEKVNTLGRFRLPGKIFNNLKKIKLIKEDQLAQVAWLLFGKDNMEYYVH
jgi:hypothetical protein